MICWFYKAELYRSYGTRNSAAALRACLCASVYVLTVVTEHTKGKGLLAKQTGADGERRAHRDTLYVSSHTVCVLPLWHKGAHTHTAKHAELFPLSKCVCVCVFSKEQQSLTPSNSCTA